MSLVNSKLLTTNFILSGGAEERKAHRVKVANVAQTSHHSRKRQDVDERTGSVPSSALQELIFYEETYNNRMN